MPFSFEPLSLAGVMVVRRREFADARGHFAELYKQSDFLAGGIDVCFNQDNISHSTLGVLRGLHFQKEPGAQAKLVTVLGGAIFDVVADVRRASPTYGKWDGVRLSASEPTSLYVPAGYAHGFCVITDTADVLYKTSGEYAPALESGVIWDDPDLAVAWPVAHPVLSPKDLELPRLRDLA